MMNIKAKRDIAHKKILNYASESKNFTKTCRYFGNSRETFYTWKRTYERDGKKGLINNKPCSENPTRRVVKHIEEMVIYLRMTYHFDSNVSLGIFYCFITSKYHVLVATMYY
ncbi:TPA: hypothetical protein ACK1SE_002664 [Proteus mirabilis]